MTQLLNLLSGQPLLLSGVIGIGIGIGIGWFLYKKIGTLETSVNKYIPERINELKVRVEKIEERLDRLIERIPNKK